ncbi:envelope stress response membrane protein PspB [Psychromonas sp.]|uniref:envelope stress response membrane protein PspB n=1 Tax=Psychromonas sp. TaxID=1884585 RepID=UPI00356A58CB
MSYIAVPLSVFFVFVAPLWLFLHYRSKKQTGKGLSAADQERLQALVKRTEEMQKRIASLESILDSEAPHWREK